MTLLFYFFELFFVVLLEKLKLKPQRMILKPKCFFLIFNRTSIIGVVYIKSSFYSALQKVVWKSIKNQLK